jgi:hypothetical protein
LTKKLKGTLIRSWRTEYRMFTKLTSLKLRLRSAETCFSTKATTISRTELRAPLKLSKS